MKELSIEEKKKPNGGIVLEDFNEGDGLYKVNLAYLNKEQVEEIESLVKKWNPESEDERIRKKLIKLLRNLFNNYSYFIKDPFYTECINWLEKQGEQKLIVPKFKVGDIVKDIEDGEVFTIKTVTKDKYIYTDDSFDWIKDQDMYVLVEQKSIDKVEPKFKVGDWIVFNGLTLYINEVVKGYYRTISKGGIPNSYDWDIDNAARPWTIKDAKDGDVLRLGGVIAIFKKYIGQEKCICYCSFCEEGNGFEIPIENGEDNVYGCIDTTPATKEQRETLFEKMKLEGYRWDEDKKEVIRFETFVRRKENDFAFEEDENGVIKFVHKS